MQQKYWALPECGTYPQVTVVVNNLEGKIIASKAGKDDFVLEYDPDRDWVDVWNRELLHVTPDACHLYNLDLATTVARYATGPYFPRQFRDKIQGNGILPTNRLRGWLTKNHILLSAEPNYNSSMMVTQIPRNTKYIWSTPFLSIMVWCTNILVSPDGAYFIIYDYEDDYTTLHDADSMEQIDSLRAASRPFILFNAVDGKIRVAMENRFPQPEGTWDYLFDLATPVAKTIQQEDHEDLD
jgi:hypothetical protein